jgi:uncharacterized membrane protein YoaK (UPF0700 family)
LQWRRQQQQQTHGSLQARQQLSVTDGNENAAAAAAKTSRQDRTLLFFGTGLAFVTGWADVALMARYRTFATMMTGNSMWMARGIADGNWAEVLYYATVIASYVAGLAWFRAVTAAKSTPNGGESKPRTRLNLCAGAVCALFVGSDIVFAKTQARFVPVAFLAAAFGIINSVGTEFAGALTFVVTGHLTRLTNLLVDHRFFSFSSSSRLQKQQQEPWSAQDQKAAIQNVAITVAFFAGALFAFGLSRIQCLQHSRRLGAFSVMGALYGALFVWKDWSALTDGGGGGGGPTWWKGIVRKSNKIDVGVPPPAASIPNVLATDHTAAPAAALLESITQGNATTTAMTPSVEGQKIERKAE